MHAFEAALEYNPKDAELITRVARALVTTHDYEGSITYYKKVRAAAACRWHKGVHQSTLHGVASELDLASLALHVSWVP